jgi:hypothetical protein
MKVNQTILSVLHAHRYYLYIYLINLILFINYYIYNLLIFQPNEHNSTTIISFDGNFQLRRLKSSGNSYENRLVNDRFIISEEFFSDWVSNNQSFYNNKLQVIFNNNSVTLII